MFKRHDPADVEDLSRHRCNEAMREIANGYASSVDNVRRADNSGGADWGDSVRLEHPRLAYRDPELTKLGLRKEQ